MDQRQLRRQLPQHRHRRRLVVDEHPPLAVRRNLPPQQNVVRERSCIDPVRLQHRHRARRQLEHAPQHRLLRPMPHHIARSLPAQQQRQRVDQDRLPRARLSRQQVQPRPKLGHRLVDHRIVFRPQLQQHPASPQLSFPQCASLARHPQAPARHFRSAATEQGLVFTFTYWRPSKRYSYTMGGSTAPMLFTMRTLYMPECALFRK